MLWQMQCWQRGRNNDTPTNSFSSRDSSSYMDDPYSDKGKQNRWGFESYERQTRRKEMSKITIDLEDLKSYIKSLPTAMEEWDNEEWALYAEGIHAYARAVDLGFANTFKSFMDEYYEERNKENRGE